MKYAILALALVLGACGTVDSTTIQKDVYTAKAAYAALLQPAIVYNALPACGQPTSPPACRDAGVVTKLRAADAEARKRLNDAETASRALPANPTTAQLALALAQQAVAAFQQVETANGVVK